MLRNLLLTTVLASGMALPCLKATPLSGCRQYVTDNLQSIASIIRLDSIWDMSEALDTVIFFDFESQAARADVRHGVVSHIGYRIFPDTLRSAKSLPIFDFLERYLLEKDLHIENQNELESNKILYSNINDTDLKTVLKKNLPFVVRTTDYLQYEVEWEKPDGVKMRITVPVSYELLHGSMLPENERRLLEELSDSGSIDPKMLPKIYQVDKEQLTPTYKTNCFILKDAYLFSEALTSDRYYQSDTSSMTSSFKILYNESYPVESISNMLSGLDIPSDNIEVELQMIVYPMEKRTIKIPLSRMIAYFLSTGCEIFVGATSVNDTDSNYIMICRNALQGYCHSLKVSVSIDDFQNKTGKAQAKITPYIPLSKILNLYSEQQ